MEALDTAGELRTLRYLPRTLVEHWTLDVHREPIWGHWLDGSLMHCDITGFTAMSESLAQMGKEGAEFMANTLNQFFERQLGIARRWNGVQMKFGGDAMLLLFSGKHHAERAAACALEMQGAMHEFSRVPVVDTVHALRMRIGIHSGRFYSASVGQADGLLHYLLFGPDVNRTADVEPMARPGQVVASCATAELLDGKSKLRPSEHDGIWVIKDVDAPLAALTTLDESRVPHDTLKRYLMPPLAEGRSTGVTGEHRRVTVIFINVVGATDLLKSGSERETLSQIDAYVKMVFAAATKHGGYLAASDASEHGEKLIVLFGAPVSLDQSEASAFRFALELQEKLQQSGLSLHHQIGINSGFVFAGEIGSTRRREYTVIGDNVNLAARLMVAAGEGNVLVSAAAARRAGPGFDLHRKRPIRVKGKSKPIHIFRLDGIADSTGQTLLRDDQSGLVGRDAELTQLLKLAKESLEGKASWAYVSGEAGIGKTRLCAELNERLCNQGWRSLVGVCYAHTEGSAFSAWINPLRAVLGLTRADEQEEAWNAIQDAVSRCSVELTPFAPLVAEVLAVPAESNPVVDSLDPQSRRDRRLETLARIVIAAALERPLLLMFDDVHWIDSPSLDLLGRVLTEPAVSILACLTSRRILRPKRLPSASPHLALNLNELSADASRRLVMAVADVDAEEAAAVTERARGNPLFLEELARSAAAGEGGLPESIHDVIMVRLDRLNDFSKQVLRAAAVVGASFNAHTVHAAVASGTGNWRSFADCLDELVEAGFLNRQRDESHYAFNSALARDVTYETILYGERRELHGTVAQHMETQRADRLEAVASTLLYHYEAANDWPKTVKFGALSGDRSGALYANQEAVEFYQRALLALSRLPRERAAEHSVLLERIGDVFDTSGEYEQAAENFQQALSVWQARTVRRTQPKLLGQTLRATLRDASLSRKVAVALERQARFDESLEWLERAERELPSRASGVAAQVYAGRSVALFRKGDLDEAIRWGRRALDLARRSRDIRRVAYAYNMLATSYAAGGQIRKAIRHWRQALSLYERQGDLSGLASTHTNLGVGNGLLGDWNAAVENFRFALDADLRMQNAANIAMNRANLGGLLLEQGQLQDAVAELEAVVTTYEAGKCPSDLAGAAMLNLFRCRLAQSDLERAEESLRRGQRLVRRTGQVALMIEAELLTADLRLAQHRPEQAAKMCQRALKKIRAHDLVGHQVLGERILGKALTELGKIDRAVEQLDLSIEMAQRIGAVYEEGISLIAKARTLMKGRTQQTTVIRQCLKRAERLLAQVGAELGLTEARSLIEALDALSSGKRSRTRTEEPAVH